MNYTGEISVLDDLVLNYGYIPQKRSMFIKTDIYNDTVTALLNFYYCSEQQSAEKDCTIFLTCQGGDVLSTFAMIDLMHAQSFKTNVFVLGKAFSSAALFTICATGDRIMSDNSFLMFHELQADFEADAASMEKEREIKGRLLNSLQQKFIMFLGMYSKVLDQISPNDIDTFLKDEHYLNKQQCLSFGMIDK